MTSLLYYVLARIMPSYYWKVLKARVVVPGLRLRATRLHKRHFYFLSTGRVGTRFFSHVLGAADNATVYHQPAPQLMEEGRKLVEAYTRDEEGYRDLSVRMFPRLEAKVLRQSLLPGAVYGDTLNHMYPFGLMLYRHLGPERLRLVHLVRNPVACGRSTLKAERDDTGHGRFALLRPPEFRQGRSAAEKAANIWIGINEMVKYQFEQINDPSVCKLFRLEDVSLETLEDLYGFLGLTGFDAGRVKSLMSDRSPQVRHSHLEQSPERPPATDKELAVIAEMCRESAETYGYDI